MKILNFGSVNIDHVYRVADIVLPGETIDSIGYESFPGGKGLNQSIALGRAGAQVYHAGMVGSDGAALVTLLENSGVNCQHMQCTQDGTKTGSAFIQVSHSGQNSIVLNGGANRCMTAQYIDAVLSQFSAGDMLLLQNEVNMIDRVIETAYQRGMIIVLNPSPMNEAVLQCALNKVSMFIMNEHEGKQITNCSNIDAILPAMALQYPNAKTVLTLGETGSVYMFAEDTIRQEAYRVNAVDTTAAGDTFTGFFLSAWLRQMPMKECLKIASKASALAVMQKGASPSIPTWEAVMGAKL